VSSLQATGPESALREIQDRFAPMRANDVAELFLSPFVHAPLFLRATEEAGPTMWIVNRSDVYDRTLEILSQHSLAEISSRSADKLRHRRGLNLNFLEPPEDVGPLNEVPDFAVEDVLGHPLAPFKAMIYFSRAISEDFRASSALSLTRRLLEHPPNWNADLGLKAQITERFSQLLMEDQSPYVRAYAARVPLIPSSILEQALRKEENPSVRARLLQNPSSTPQLLEQFLGNATTIDLGWGEMAYAAHRVAAFDERLHADHRRSLREIALGDPITRATVDWFLTAN